MNTLDQLAQLNQLFRAGFQPLYDTNAAQVAIAQEGNRRAYNEGQRQAVRAEGKADEAEMFKVRQKRQAQAAKAALIQMNQPADKVADMSDEAALYAYEALAHQKRVESEVKARTDAEWDKNAKAARGMLKSLKAKGKLDDDIGDMSDEEAMALADLKKREAEQILKLETDRKVQAAMLDPKEEAEAQALRIDTSAPASEVRAQLYARREAIQQAQHTSAGEAIRAIDTRRNQLQQAIADREGAKHDDNAARLSWARTSAPKDLKEYMDKKGLNMASDLDVLNALRANPKLASGAEGAVAQGRDDFLKMGPERRAEISALTRELTSLNSKLDDFRKGYNPYYDAGSMFHLGGKQGAPELGSHTEGEPVAAAPTSDKPDPMAVLTNSGKVTKSSAPGAVAVVPKPVVPSAADQFVYERPFQQAEAEAAKRGEFGGPSLAVPRDFFFNLLKPSAPRRPITNPRDPSYGGLFLDLNNP